MNIDISECLNFVGGWSISPHAIYFSLKYLECLDEIKILEIGSGDGTKKLCQLLKYKNIKFEYDSFETNKDFANSEHVNYLYYKEKNILKYKDFIKSNKQFDFNKKYNLIILDGPKLDESGYMKRVLWLKNIRQNIQSGTIILIDDFSKLKNFQVCIEKELNLNYNYENINTFSADKKLNILSNFGIDKVNEIDTPEAERNKKYKIVKILKIKKKFHKKNGGL